MPCCGTAALMRCVQLERRSAGEGRRGLQCWQAGLIIIPWPQPVCASGCGVAQLARGVRKHTPLLVGTYVRLHAGLRMQIQPSRACRGAAGGTKQNPLHDGRDGGPTTTTQAAGRAASVHVCSCHCGCGTAAVQCGTHAPTCDTTCPKFYMCHEIECLYCKKRHPVARGGALRTALYEKHLVLLYLDVLYLDVRTRFSWAHRMAGLAGMTSPRLQTGNPAVCHPCCHTQPSRVAYPLYTL